jgi:hypothetical protein
MASTEGSATVTSNAILGKARSKIPSEHSRNLASGSPLTTFEPFLQLPVELQLQVIKYAWLNEIQMFNRDIKVTVIEDLVDDSVHLHFQNAKLPSLCLVSKSFLNECRLLARPYLISVPSLNGSKYIRFIPHLDHVLNLEVTGRRIYDFMLIFFLNAIPLELRQSLKHVRVQTNCKKEALWWFYIQRGVIPLGLLSKDSMRRCWRALKLLV